MKKVVFRFWGVICIFGIWFVFSSPYFIQSLVPYPSRYQVSFFPPWSAYQQYWGPVKNNAMPDVIDQIYPWKHFTVTLLKSGTIPYWNPNNFAGNPHVANFQSAVFSPFNLLYFLLPFVDAWSIIILLQPLLAGWFTYLLLRELKISPAGAVLGSVSFMFCGFMVVWMAYGTLAMAVAFLPLALWGIEKGFNKNKWYFGLMTAATVISFFSGHFQTSFYFVVYVLAYLVFRAFSNHGLPIKSRMTRFTWAIVLYILAFVISLPQLYPTVQFYQESVRSGLAYQGGGIPLDYLITALAPDFYGNPVTRNDWRGNYAEWASFIGIVPFVFALLAFRVTKDRRRYFFMVLGLSCLLFSMETPLRAVMIATNLPIIATSIPSRLIVLFSFSFAVLAGYGLTEFQSWGKKNFIRNGLPSLLFVFVLLSVAALSVGILHVFPEGENKLALKNLVLPGVLFIIICGLFFSIRIFSSRKIIITITALMLMLAAFDSYRFASKWMPFDPKPFVFPDVPVLSAMKEKIGFGRVYGNLGTEVTTYYGLPSLEGYDPLYSQRYGEFIMYSRQGNFMSAERSVVRLDRRGKYTEKVLDLLGVTIIFHPLADTGQIWAYPVWEDIKKYSVIYQDDTFQLYRNNTAMPRVSLFYRYEVVPNGKKLLQRFYSPDFDFRNILLLEEKPVAINLPSGNATGSAKIVSYTPNTINVAVETNEVGLLFLSDIFYPGWKVTVNGEEKKIFRANYAFKAIEVSKGKSIVTFSYSPYFR